MSMAINIGAGDGAKDPDHYSALGVDEEATEHDIRSAYYRLVREFRPNDHPEEFQRFSDATHTLSDPRRRGAYDQTRRNGRRVQVLVDQAAKAQDKDPHKAIALLKNAIALGPDVARPRQLLAQVLMRIEEHAAAERQYRWLIKENQRDETLHFKLARAVWLQGRTEDARACLETVFRLNARYHDAILLLARIEEQEGNRKRAAELLQQAVANDGKENFADAEALLRLLVLHLQNEDGEEAERTAARLKSVLPADNPGAVDKFARRILHRANDLYHAENFTAAASLVDLAASAASGEDEDLTAKIEALRMAVQLRDEARQIQADDLVTGALKTFLSLRYLEKTLDAMRQKLDVIQSQLQSEVASQPRDLCTVIDYLRGEYPNVAREQERLLAELHERATKRLLADSRAGTTMAMPEILAEPEDSAVRKNVFGWLRGGSK